MNHLTTLTPLKNNYFAMRHGTSVANEAGLIVSDPARGTAGYGLSERGREEVHAAADDAKRDGTLDANTVIITSDFTRAHETANILAETLDVLTVTATPKLRERFFGNFDGSSDQNYATVWSDDAKNPAQTDDGVESVEHVIDRVTALIAELESRYSDRRIVLVSHGDTLGALQSAFAETEIGMHSTSTLLRNAEIRSLSV